MSRTDGLTSYKPGQSGNLKGRPKGKKNRGTILRELLALQDKGGENTEIRLEQAIILKALNGDVAAYKEIKDTMYGKITDTSVNLNVDTDEEHIPEKKMKEVAASIIKELQDKY